MNAPYLLWIKLGATVALVLGIFGAGHHVGAKGVRDDWNAANLARAGADKAAIVQRGKDNAIVAAKQDAINSTITKAKDEALAPVIRRIATDRVRVGPALCSGLTAAAKAESPSISNGGDSPPRLVRSDVEADIRALMIAMEEDAATGRAAQEFIVKNGLAP